MFPVAKHCHVIDGVALRGVTAVERERETESDGVGGRWSYINKIKIK